VSVHSPRRERHGRHQHPETLGAANAAAARGADDQEVEMKEMQSAVGGRVAPVVQARLAEVAVRGAVGLRSRLHRDQRGMISAEWAVGIIAAVAIAGVLLSVVTSGPVEAGILKFILQVIKAFSGGIGRL
jgi:hypothetical protein